MFLIFEHVASAQVLRTTFAVKHFVLGGREVLETAVIDLLCLVTDLVSALSFQTSNCSYTF